MGLGHIRFAARKSSDTKIIMFSNILIFILRRRPKFIVLGVTVAHGLEFGIGDSLVKSISAVMKVKGSRQAWFNFWVAT